MLDAVNTWLRWGVHSQPDWTLKRKVFHTNIGALMALMSLSLYCLGLSVFIGSRSTSQIVVAELPFFVLLAMVPWLNRKGHDNLARWALVFSAMASQLIAVLVAFGSYLNVHLYFLLFAFLPIAVFPTRQWGAISVLFVVNSAFYLAFEYIGYPPAAEVLGWDKTIVQVVRTCYAATTAMTLFIFIWLIEVVAETSEAKLETISMTDHLTDLPNRRFFETVLVQEIATHRRDQAPLTLAMLDIDHFKVVNDTHGHDVGDAVLKHIAQTLRHATREGNVVARVGGEEFAILLPNTHLPEAMEVAERVRQAVEAHNHLLKGQPLRVTISIGVAPVNCELPMAQAYKLADNALYQAKREGRNRVVSVTPPGQPVV